MQGMMDTDYVEIRKLSPRDEGQYFYGYYDNLAFHPAKPLHLCHRTAFMDRLPEADDVCELGILNGETGQFEKAAETRAWNFQQGAMLQWNPGNFDEIIYNVFEDGHYQGVIKNIVTGKEKRIERPLANVSPDGRWGLSINMNRVYDFRPGYGYCNLKDPWAGENAPEQDGVFLDDLETGTARQILSYKELARIFEEPDRGFHKLTINHITFNRESTRFLFLIRYWPEDGESWKTGLGTSDREGNVYRLRPYTYASHYYWGENGKLLIYADCGAGEGLYELRDETQEFSLFDRQLFHEDIHCSYSPDRQWIIGDGYQDEKEYRPVFLYHIKSKKGMVIGRFYSPHLSSADIRCDLHCRWAPDGTGVSFDSIHEGKRGVYFMDVTNAMDKIKKGGIGL